MSANSKKNKRESESNNQMLFKLIRSVSNNYFLLKELVENQIKVVELLSDSLSSILNIDRRSSLILSLLINYSYPGGKVTITEIKELLSIQGIKVYSIKSYLEELIVKDFLVQNISKRTSEITYSLTVNFESVVESIMNTRNNIS